MPNEDQAPQGLQELGKYLTQVGQYVTAVGSQIDAGAIDWSALRPPPDWQRLAKELEPEHAEVLADALTVLVLGRQPIRDDLTHALAEYVGAHDNPARVVTRLGILLAEVPSATQMPTAQLQAGIQALRNKEDR